MSSIFHLRPDWLPSCTPLMILIMMDITMAKRSIMYDTNETYDSFKVVEGKWDPSEAEEAGSLNLIMAVSDSYSSYSTIVLQCVGLQGMKVM